MNFDPVFFWCENKAKVIRRPRVSTSGNLNKMSVREKSRGVYLAVGWVFLSYSMTIAYVKREKIMHGCG